jgi:glycosyltransferase involved in cell wall biosynthesis
MIGVIIPVHDEAMLLDRCLRAVMRAAADPRLGGEPVRIFVALDDCSDGSAAIAAAHQVTRVTCAVRDVGTARACAAERAIAAGARWIASTDADSRVPRYWLSAQLAHGADAVCGIIRIADWSPRDSRLRRLYDRHYMSRDGHRHVHGANLGVSTCAYLRAGGFVAGNTSEDVSLVYRLQQAQARIAWAARPCVVTSARRSHRCKGGFSAYLDRLGLALEGERSPRDGIGALA